MKAHLISIIFGAIVLTVLTSFVGYHVNAAGRRLAEETGAAPADAGVAIAAASDEGYCTPELKQILRRVLTSCGLVKSGGQQRGCQPADAKNVASMSGGDFNALFTPLSKRAAIVQFDQAQYELDANAVKLLDDTFADQRGASYFLVVSRSSPEGAVEKNRKLSQDRAGSVLAHLQQRFTDPDLEREVGLLWLGEEFAQLSEEFCTWNRSRTGTECTNDDLNRSAFIAWIDCRL